MLQTTLSLILTTTDKFSQSTFFGRGFEISQTIQTHLLSNERPHREVRTIHGLKYGCCIAIRAIIWRTIRLCFCFTAITRSSTLLQHPLSSIFVATAATFLKVFFVTTTHNRFKFNFMFHTCAWDILNQRDKDINKQYIVVSFINVRGFVED